MKLGVSSAPLSKDAEIAAWDSTGEWFRFEDQNDSVKGWVKPDEVADFIAMIKEK
jgi:hypothetical protein